MLHTVEYKIASVDAELKRRRPKRWYDDDDVSPDELLDLRLRLMKERNGA